MLYILPKKATLCVVFVVVMLFSTSSVAAQAASDVSVTFAAKVNILSNGSGESNYAVGIKNNSENLVKSISLPVLAGAVPGIEVKLGGSPVYFTTDTKGDYTVLNIDLQGAAIRPNDSKTIDIRITSTRVIQAKFGIYEFLIPRIESDFIISNYTLELTYVPDSLPPLAYTSSLDKDGEQNKIVMDSKSGFWVVWGNDAIIDLKGEVKVEGNNTVLTNLIPRLPNQEVVYKQIDKVNGLAEDEYSNLWAVINPLQFNDAVYQARVHNIPDQLYVIEDIDYPEVQIPEIIKPLLDSRSTEEKINLIYSYLIDTYQPETEVRKPSPQLGSVLPENDKKLLPIEYAFYMAGLLKQIKIESNIVYGFYFSQFASFNNLNINLPQVWLEIKDNGIRTYDPYFQEITGWKGANASLINKVIYGKWDPQNYHDSVLGLLSAKAISSPQVVELGEIANDLTFEVSVEFPETVLSGSYYEGKLTIVNKSAIPLALDSIFLDNQNLSEQLLSVGNGYKLVAKPYGATEITVPQYMNLDILRAYTKSGRLTVKAEADQLVPQVAKYQIKFVPNYGLTAAFISIGFIVGGIILVFLFRRQVLIKLMKRQYYN